VSRYQVATAATLLTLVATVSANGAELLRLVQTIPLPNVEGRIDHFGYDAKGSRLFMAALGNDTVEIIDLASGKVAQRIKNLKAPQGISYAHDVNRLAVANDKDGSVRLYDGATLEQVQLIDLKDDADNVRYDPDARRFWVGYGDGALAAIDPQTGKVLATVKLDAHPESFQLEAKGKRIFANVAAATHVAVVDRDSATVIAKWKLTEAESNFPMALDESNHRLFVGCRKPAKLVVLDTQTGKTAASVEIVGDTDDIFYDAANNRLYVAGGEGRITVVEQTDADHYAVAGQINTALGARTAYFVRETGMFYLAVPHRGAQPAEIRVFKAKAVK
jgi:DNA-binding beta-propeller fold protein YncE